MALKKNNTGLEELLLQCLSEPDPMLSMLDWLCSKLMEAEISGKAGADKNEHSEARTGYRSGYRPRRLDTRMGTMYLMLTLYSRYDKSKHKKRDRPASGLVFCYSELQ